MEVAHYLYKMTSSFNVDVAQKYGFGGAMASSCHLLSDDRLCRVQISSQVRCSLRVAPVVQRWMIAKLVARGKTSVPSPSQGQCLLHSS